MSLGLRRVLMAALLGLVLGFVVSLWNTQQMLASICAGLVMALVAGVLAALLSWGISIAQQKGYSAWIGFLLVLLLNFLGILLLLLLPSTTERTVR